jgi:hypothetical protein
LAAPWDSNRRPALPGWFPYLCKVLLRALWRHTLHLFCRCPDLLRSCDLAHHLVGPALDQDQVPTVTLFNL